MSTLQLQDAETGETHDVSVTRLLVAGFTGRDTQAVEAHVEELAAEGVPVPETIPSLYRLDPSLVTQSAAITVDGANTSGEVEPVIVVTDGGRLLTVGSDHTDRDLEREDISDSKAACPKIIGSRCVPLDRIEDWDRIEIESQIDDGELYQRGSLASLLPVDHLVQWLEDDEDVTLADGDVLFLGTIAARGGIRPADRFSASLRVPGDGELTLNYRIHTNG